MTEETKFFDMLFRTPTDQFVDTLNMLMVIDLGIIESIDVNGRATVTLSKIRNGSPVQLKDIEVIGFGNNNGAFTVDGAGCPCLLFAPRTTMPNLKDAKVDWSAPAYSKGGIKALPISNGRDLLVNACFSSDGSLNISSDNYLLNFGKDLISFIEKIGLSVQITPAGDIQLYRRTEQSGIFRFTLSDSGISSSFKNSQGQLVYGTQVSEDGTLSITAPKGITVNIDSDGNISIQTEGTLNVKASTISFNDGNLEISS